MVMMTKMKKTRLALATNSHSVPVCILIHFVRVVFKKTKQNKNNLDWRVFTNSARIAFQLTLNWETPYFLAFSSFTKTNQIFIFVCWTSKVGYSFAKDTEMSMNFGRGFFKRLLNWDTCVLSHRR